MALTLTFWNNEQNPVHTTLDHLMDDLRNDDMREGLMYEPCTMDDILDGTQPAETLIMDAIISQYSKLTAKMNIMQRVMSRSGVNVKNVAGDSVPLTVVGYQISDPFMRLGTANVVALFELSDGQTVSIYFHNPDVTPKKITPQDEVISFKWLLNKKDITIVVAPEKGKDIDVRQVAMRIMKIAAKNSAAFARQNKNRKERLERVDALRTRVAEKEKILAQKLKKIDELNYLKAQEEVDRLEEEDRLMKSDITPELYAELKSLGRLQDRADELDQIHQNRALELRNELRKRHWVGERYQPLMKEGYTLLEDYHYAGTGTSIIGVTYRISELNFSYVDDLSQPTAEIVEKIDGVVNAALKTVLANSRQEDQEAISAEKEETNSQDDTAITITGKEFGEFDTSTQEGKAALREKAFEYLNGLVDREETVFCKALNANVRFVKSAAKKYKRLSANPVKSILAFKIKELIAAGIQFKDSIEDYEGKVKLYYHYLKSSVIIDNEKYGVRLVIREDSVGNYHYDLQVAESFEAILDSVDMENGRSGSVNKADFFCHSPQETETFGANKSPVSSLSQAQSELQSDNTAILDGTQENNANGINQVFLDDTLQAKAVIALNYVSALDNSVLTDGTQLAEEQLNMALQVLENNLPINEQEGNVAQAELEREHIASIKEALVVLQSQPTLDSAESEGRYVLNLFVEYQDENGNWVELKDDEDELEAPTEEPENDTEPENSQSAPVLLHTSSLYQGEGYRPILAGRDEEIEQFKQAGYTLEPFSIEGKSSTYSVYKTEEPYDVHITTNWYSNGDKSYWVDVSPQEGYVINITESNGEQPQVAGAYENAKSVTEAIQLADKLIEEEKRYRPLRKAAPTLNGYYQATKGRSRTYYFNVWHNQEESEYGAYIQWSAGGKEEIKASSDAELKQKVEAFFHTYVKGNLPEIVFVKGQDILGILPKETISENDQKLNQQEQEDKTFLEKTIAGDFDPMSDEFESMLTEIAERYDGKKNEMEELTMKAVNAFTAKLDQLSA